MSPYAYTERIVCLPGGLKIDTQERGGSLETKLVIVGLR